MKFIFKILSVLLVAILLSSCDNDDANTPNLNQCNYPGLTIEDSNGNISTQISEADLQTEYFPNNGGPGIAGIEVYETSNPGNIWITTAATSVGDMDSSSTIGLNGTTYTCTVSCQRAGTQVGEEIRLDIVIPTYGNAEAELCVVIDSVNP